jgi:hypothetical protein
MAMIAPDSTIFNRSLEESLGCVIEGECERVVERAMIDVALHGEAIVQIESDTTWKQNT